MSREENSTDPLQLTVDMVRRRDDMRTLLGDDYRPSSRIARAVLKGVAKDHGVSLIDAALMLCIQMRDASEDSSIIIAALVDELQGVAV